MTREKYFLEKYEADVTMGIFKKLLIKESEKGVGLKKEGTGRKQEETVPSSEHFVWRKGEVNPVSQDVGLEGNLLRYLCPTCNLPVWVPRSRIDRIVGVSVQCPNCKNISHVPGAFWEGALPRNFNITGGVIVQVKQFNEWYLNHPVVKSLMNNHRIELQAHYGLYGFCGKCFHQYRSTVLSMLDVYQNMEPGHIIFNAKSAESADDFNALLSGKCPSCGSDKMICIVTDIPDYVEEAIAAKRKTP